MNNAEVLITFKGDASGVESATKGIEQSMKNLQKTGELALAGIGIALDKIALDVLGTGVAYNAQIETYLTRLETLTGSAEKANEVLEQIKKDALKTPFEVSSLTQAESLLLSTGMSAEEARADILALGDAVSASGGGNAELQRMAVNLQQIKNVGKASALDIKQFAYAGIDIYGLLADSMGITREEASKMDITYDMLSEALKKASSEGGKYYGAMEKQSETYNGAMGNLKESIEVLKGEIAKDLFKALKKIIPVISKFVDWLTKNHKIITAIAVPLLVFFNLIMGFLAVSKVITIIGALFAVLAAHPILAIVAAIAALVAGILYLWNNCEGFRNFILAVFEVIKKAFMFLYNSIKFYIELWALIIKWILDEIISFKNKVKEKIDAVVQFFKDIPEKIKEIPGKIEDFFKDLPENFKKIGEDIINGLVDGMFNKWNLVTKTGGKAMQLGNDIGNWFRKKLGIHSPSTVFAEIGSLTSEGFVLGFTETMKKSSKQLTDSIGTSFNLSPTLTGTAQTHLSPNVNVVVNNNMKTDPLGQLVNNVKTFSGGAKNDYNYGYGG